MPLGETSLLSRCRFLWFRYSSSTQHVHVSIHNNNNNKHPYNVACSLVTRLITTSTDNNQRNRKHNKQRVATIINNEHTNAIDATWEKHFAALKQFRKSHGHCIVPQNYNTESTTDCENLYDWVQEQRRKWRQTRLSQKQLTLLKSLDFAWDNLDIRWQQNWMRAVEYRQQQKLKNKQSKRMIFSKQEKKAIRSWMKHQRLAYRNWIHGKPSSMTPSRHKKLVRTGILSSSSQQRPENELKKFRTLQETDEEWAQKYAAVKEFRRQNGLLPTSSENETLFRWLIQQRKLYQNKIIGKNLEFSPSRSNHLKPIFAELESQLMNPHSNIWMKQYEALQAFKQNHGTCLVQSSQNQSLASWVALQIMCHRMNLLSDRQIQLLDALDFEWPLKRKGLSWMALFARLQKWKLKNGNLQCKLPKYLQEWTDTQLEFARCYGDHPVSMTKEQRDMFLQWLVSTRNHSLFDVYGDTIHDWNENYKKLAPFYNGLDHVDLPARSQAYAKLKVWERKQRKLHASGLLQQSRYEQLDILGFWDNVPLIWLRKYHAIFNHLKICGPDHVTRSMYRWLRKHSLKLKRDIRQGNDTPLVKKKLSLIYRLNIVRKSVRCWNQMYEKLKHYKEMYGDAHVPQMFTSDPKLGRWVKSQRFLWKRGRLSDERIHRLNELGFCWEDVRWRKKVDLVEQYIAERGEFSIPSRKFDTSLNTWVKRQRQAFFKSLGNQHSLISERRKEILGKLGVLRPIRMIKVKSNHEDAGYDWIYFYDKLVHYIQKNGFGKIPDRNEDRLLHDWILRQQDEYAQWLVGKDSSMTKKQETMLDELGIFLVDNKTASL